jgi:RNA recognition motif-containing protein
MAEETPEIIEKEIADPTAEDLLELEAYMSDDEDDDLDEQEEIPFSQDLSNILLVDGLPKIPAEKLGKLKNVIMRTYTQFGVVDPEEGIYMPINKETGKTFGFCFVEFTSGDVKTAQRSTDNYKLDKRHTFKVWFHSCLGAVYVWCIICAIDDSTRYSRY